MRLLYQLRSLRPFAVAGVMFLGGCSLLGGDQSSSPAAPPMMGSAQPDESAPNHRQKYRFATEVSNTRKEHLAARRRAAAQAPAAPVPAADALASANPITARAPLAAPPLLNQNGPLYPHTGIGVGIGDSTFAAAPIAQRLPDVRQASFGDQPLY